MLIRRSLLKGCGDEHRHPDEERFHPVDGDSGMNTAVLLRGGTIITDNTGEFAGAYMKGGSLIIRGKARAMWAQI